MIIWEQRNNFTEDGSGTWQEVFRISDVQAGIFSANVSTADFTGGGLDDITAGGTYTGVEPLEFLVKIDGEGTPDSFKWSIDGGLTWEDTTVNITGAAQTLQDGITITFAATTGHTEEDYWEFSVIGTANIFDVGDIKNDVELKSGKLAEDEMDFQINTAIILSHENRTKYLEALQFVLDAQTSSNRRYVGFFIIRPGYSLTANNNLFNGVVLPEQKWSDLAVNDAEWAEILDAVREWNFTCQPFSENVMDNYDTEEVIDEIDSSWESANVADRQSGFYNSATRYDMHVDLVNLNKLLKKLTDCLAGLIFADGLGSYTIDYDVSKIDGQFRPCRFESDIMHYLGRWRSLGARPNVWQYPTDDPYILTGNEGKLKLGVYADVSGGDVSDEVSPFISYRMIKAEENITSARKERNLDLAKEMLWEKNDKCKKFTDLLYYLAANFGMFLKFYFSDTDTITIQFIGRQSFLGVEVYIRDFTKTEGTVSPVDPSESDKYETKGYYYTSGMGNEYYGIGKIELNQKPEIKGKELICSLSPIIKTTQLPKELTGLTKELIESMDGAFSKFGCFPHNIIEVLGGIDTFPDYMSSPGVTTAIYSKVSPYGYTYEPAGDYFAPLGVWEVNSKTYRKMHDYLNEINQLEKGFFEKELTGEVPYLCNFSASALGTNPSWANIQLGSLFSYNSLEFACVSITRSIRNKTTQLKFHNSDRFTFADLTVFNAIEDEPDIAVFDDGPEMDEMKASGAINKCNICILNEDGTISVAKSWSSHYRKIYCLALEAASDGNYLRVLKEGGEWIESDWSTYIDGLSTPYGTVGQKVWLKNYALINPSGLNLTINPLMVKTGTAPYRHNLIACIGEFITPYTIKLNFNEQWIIK